MESIISTEKFWKKDFTKCWLADNTSFQCPKNAVELTTFYDTIEQLSTVPDGCWVFKPNIGRKSHGVLLFERQGDQFQVFSKTEKLSLEDFKEEVVKIVRQTIFSKKKIKEHRRWFVEEWIYPHKKLWSFTDDRRVPPIIRFRGCPTIHVIDMAPLYCDLSGIAPSGFKERRYIWLDLQGVIRPVSDMNLDLTDTRSRETALEKSVDNAPFGEKIDGIVEIMERINREIVPKIRLYNKCSWSCDGTFDKDDNFIIIEMNHTPGLQFKGFSWGDK